MIRSAKKQDELTLRLLWDKCFPGEPEFTELFFKHMYETDYCRVYDVDGAPVAMLHAFPYSLHTPEYNINSYYIYGVGCEPEFRGRGFAGSLIEDTVLHARKNRIDLCMLIPQNDGLFNYYERFGFSPVFFTDIIDIKQIKKEEFAVCVSSATQMDIDFINSIYEKALDAFIFAKRDRKHWEMLLYGARSGGGDICVFKKSDNICAYAVFNVLDKTLVINELFSIYDDIYDIIPDYLARLNGCTNIKLTRPGLGKRLGAAYFITENATKAFEKTPAYLNLMHN